MTYRQPARVHNPRHGLALLELLVVLVIFAIFLIPSAYYFNRNLQESRLDDACARVVETLRTAKASAENRRVSHTVAFDKCSFAIYRAGTLVGKVSSLPAGVVVREKTAGFSPAEFLPEGNAKEAGSLLLEETKTRKSARIVLYNLTGKVIVEKNP